MEASSHVHKQFAAEDLEAGQLERGLQDLAVSVFLFRFAGAFQLLLVKWYVFKQHFTFFTYGLLYLGFVATKHIYVVFPVV